MRRRLAAAAAVFGFGICGQAAMAMELVSPQSLKRDWLDGRAVTTVGPRGGKSELTFRNDGTLVRTGGRAGAAGEGSWRLDDEGFCMTLGQAKRESCYVAIRGEGGAIRVMRRTGAFVWTR
ncbi:hypothetical protein [Chenggangzhangella methanolivorans]|uniref:Uncharacterized protein n=1 Tax=Chenggangzhangella methanolivorans TaxID=1437009 RepID=A0A9E6RC38_9HYPH|nr:hypothetical protein [Chenggangzhangella methanolivorans]QZO01600.1 hypothetical protein K6K41_09450 [Chenggangzhangella methanolivorans]